MNDEALRNVLHDFAEVLSSMGGGPKDLEDRWLLTVRGNIEKVFDDGIPTVPLDRCSCGCKICDPPTVFNNGTFDLGGAMGTLDTNGGAHLGTVPGPCVMWSKVPEKLTNAEIDSCVPNAAIAYDFAREIELLVRAQFGVEDE